MAANEILELESEREVLQQTRLALEKDRRSVEQTKRVLETVSLDSHLELNNLILHNWKKDKVAIKANLKTIADATANLEG